MLLVPLLAESLVFRHTTEINAVLELTHVSVAYQYSLRFKTDRQEGGL